jgi:hypothetical protein
MNLRELFKGIFSLVIRLIGLAFLYQAAEGMPFILATLYSMPFRLAYRDLTLITRVLMVVWEVALAYWMMRGAPQLMRLAYPEGENPPPSPTTRA